MARSAKPGTERITPASSGGPGTSRGHLYQIEYAVLQALGLVAQFLFAPLKFLSIVIEPRIVHPEDVTRWDVQTSPPLALVEAKANATKNDLVEFLERVSRTSGLDPDARLQLVYGHCSTALLASAIRLRGVAIECGPDRSRFDELVAREEIPNATVILKALGSGYREHLPRLVFESLPEGLLKRELEFRSRHLAPTQPQQLIDFLFRRFSEGALSRQRYEASQLVISIEQAGIALTRPAEVKLADLAPALVAAMALLQVTSSGLPGTIVASVVGVTTEQLQDLSSNSNLVSIEEGIWRIRPLPFQVFVPNRADLLCQGFERLLDYLFAHETDKTAERQLRNAVILARECLPLHPGLALPLFQATEHIVKNMGDKHLLLEISDLCIHAGQQHEREDAERRARARAQALLCGRSWVLQRTSRLAEARLWAERSLQLGEDIGWDRNTAFAKKCIGRLDRLEAEQPGTSSEHKVPLLQASADKLREAIGMFSNSREFGPTDRQVGDCYSLLARTYLVARRRDDASAALQKAYEVLPASPTKEYFDLLILTGDIEVRWGSREQAEVNYCQVIDQHSQEGREHSEIYARALSRRAANRVKMGRRPLAIADYERAAAVWRSLDEHEEAAKVDLAKIELEGKIETNTLQLFSTERSALVRLSALRIYIEQLEGTKALARRSRPTAAHVDQYLKEARKRNALEYPEW
jgi:tetratricopeptide (TPR) repeat protein